jgi:hypothetical protein
LLLILFFIHGDSIGRNPVFFSSPRPQIDQSTSVGTKRAVGVTFPGRLFPALWAIHFSKFHYYQPKKNPGHPNNPRVNIYAKYLYTNRLDRFYSQTPQKVNLRMATTSHKEIINLNLAFIQNT